MPVSGIPCSFHGPLLRILRCTIRTHDATAFRPPFSKWCAAHTAACRPASRTPLHVREAVALTLKGPPVIDDIPGVIARTEKTDCSSSHLRSTSLPTPLVLPLQLNNGPVITARSASCGEEIR
ncbi:hypothetical protein A0H81_05577 [Grifola frondosa]|uniref:Uncharacterized protein n=1 Tax=Grifola frondosa TaxID=5627 RepID=A0A1C7MIE3_GRIFR|nr:hypothetical protein A0H81_05577 [Grifola frondosa]